MKRLGGSGSCSIYYHYKMVFRCLSRDERDEPLMNVASNFLQAARHRFDRLTKPKHDFFSRL